jgi:hypothetical protein
MIEDHNAVLHHLALQGRATSEFVRSLALEPCEQCGAPLADHRKFDIRWPPDEPESSLRSPTTE